MATAAVRAGLQSQDYQCMQCVTLVFAWVRLCTAALIVRPGIQSLTTICDVNKNSTTKCCQCVCDVLAFLYVYDARATQAYTLCDVLVSMWITGKATTAARAALPHLATHVQTTAIHLSAHTHIECTHTCIHQPYHPWTPYHSPPPPTYTHMMILAHTTTHTHTYQAAWGRLAVLTRCICWETKWRLRRCTTVPGRRKLSRSSDPSVETERVQFLSWQLQRRHFLHHVHEQ